MFTPSRCCRTGGVSGSWDDTTKLWDVKHGECVQTLKERGGIVNALTMLSDGRLASGAYDRIYIAGKLKTSKWQDKNNEPRYTTEVIADELIMLDSKSSET